MHKSIYLIGENVYTDGFHIWCCLWIHAYVFMLMYSCIYEDLNLFITYNIDNLHRE